MHGQACTCATLPASFRPNLSWISADLAVGGRVAEGSVAHLAETLGIRAIVDLRSEDRDDAGHLARHGIAFLHLPTDDHGAPAPGAIEAGIDVARAAARRSERLLVHCEHGIGRSALLALCILVDRGVEPLAALALCKDRRPVVSPSPAQYEGWCAWLRLQPSVDARHVPGFGAFAAIAYRHLRRA